MMHKRCHVVLRDEAHAHLPPVEPLDVEIGESETLLPAGTVSSMLEGTIVVQVHRLTPPFCLGASFYLRPAGVACIYMLSCLLVAHCCYSCWLRQHRRV